MSDQRRKDDLPLTSQFPSLDQMQQWTRSLGQAQQLLLEYATDHIGKAAAAPVPEKIQAADIPAAARPE